MLETTSIIIFFTSIIKLLLDFYFSKRAAVGLSQDQGVSSPC